MSSFTHVPRPEAKTLFANDPNFKQLHDETNGPAACYMSTKGKFSIFLFLMNLGAAFVLVRRTMGKQAEELNEPRILLEDIAVVYYRLGLNVSFLLTLTIIVEVSCDKAATLNSEEDDDQTDPSQKRRPGQQDQQGQQGQQGQRA